MFIDKTKVHVRAGKGGNGVVAWRREKYEPSGGPFGGDGGNGGNIIIEADEGIRTLMDFRYKRSYHGENGESGRSKKQFGKAGGDIVLKVPVGTLVKDEETENVIVDFKEHGQTFLIARGGRGGRGNAKFATATRQAPNFAEPGRKGQERDIILEIKLIADVGLIGFPNVGKSTILSTISAAKPKIANYHFTTLQPNLGVVRIGDEKSFVIADIPGLIEGAHEGLGLGHAFLKHIERTKVLVHVLDISGSEARDPIEDFKKINNELVKYNIKLEDKPQIIAANKIDLLSEEEQGEVLERLRKEVEESDYKIFPISAATIKGIEELKYGMWELLSNVDWDHETFDEEFVFVEDKENEEGKEIGITVRKENGEYIVEGEFIERLLESTYFDNPDSLRYFQDILRRRGVIDKLKELGINENESVFMADYEFEFFE